MPDITVWILRLAFVQFGLAWSLGALILMQRGGWLLLPDWIDWRFPHAYMLLFGWVLQICMGVGFWILPKFTTADEHFYGYVIPFYVAIVALNLGVILSVFSLTGAHILLVISAVSFAIHIWKRIKPFRTT